MMSAASHGSRALASASGLALLHGHDGRNLVGALAQQIGGLAHHLRALEGRELAPDLEALVRRLERLVEVGLLGVGNRADDLFGCRIEDGKGLSGGGRAPFSVNQQQYVRVIHSCSLRSQGFLPPRGQQHVRPRPFKSQGRTATQAVPALMARIFAECISALTTPDRSHCGRTIETDECVAGLAIPCTRMPPHEVFRTSVSQHMTIGGVKRCADRRNALDEPISRRL